MLTNSFRHIPGIGQKTERKLWALGVDSWESALDKPLPGSLRGRFSDLRERVRESAVALERGNASFFTRRMPAFEHWRLYREFQSSVVYLDIETSSGLWPGREVITTIALYDGDQVYSYVHGQNLDSFPSDIRAYKLIVTYNGRSFDVPFIEKYFGIEIVAAHIDLRYVLRSLGYSGGLKSCERQLGIDRGSLDGLDGYFAVLLWHDYVTNHNERALETLLAYNIEDVINLETLMIHSYNMKIAETPFARTHRYETPQPPEVAFQPDAETIRRIRRRHSR